jgi:hypothetical protein
MGLAVKKPVRVTKEELYALARLKKSPLKTSTKYQGSSDASSTSQPNKKCT